MPLPHLWLHLPNDSAGIPHAADRDVQGWAVTRNVGFTTPVQQGWVRVPVEGRYRIDICHVWPSNSSGRRTVVLERNIGGQPVVEVRRNPFPLAGPYCNATMSEVLWLAAGEYVRTLAYQNSGGSLPLRGAGDGSLTSFKVTCEDVG